MAESGSTRLMVNLLVNDVTISELPVKLHIKLESAGITIESIPTQVVRPMFLGGGEARVLTGDDFAEYLRLDNLNFKGFSKAAYQKSGHLPGGLWKVSVSVRHFYTNSVISNVGAATAWITSYKPPVLTAPKNNDIEPSNAALPLTFSWQASKHVGGTSAIMYRFEMWERRVEGVPAQTVAATIPPIYSTETAGLTATVLPATLALEPGMKYCWRVTAYDPSGMVTIENKGESEVRTFQYLEKCPEVCGLTVDVKDDTGYASWEENRQHLGGYNFEFYDDEGTCHKTLWGSSTKTAGIGGEYGKTWHVRVQGLCRSGVEGPWSDWVDFKIPDAFKPLKDENGNTFECGKEVPERVITNFTLKDNLQKGDTIENRPGTTKFVIHSATRNEDGSFRGLSYMLMRIWGVSFLGEFDHLNVNTDGVIIGKYAWRTVNMGPGVVTPEDIERWADETALAIAGATYNNTIKDTVTLCCGIKFESIRREGNRYYALRNDTLPVEITSAINGKNRTLIKDDNGHELVIDKDGNVMGVEEYTKCGGSKALLRESIKEKDSQVTRSGNVKFLSAGDYLFDSYDNYSGKTGYAERFPSIGEGDYKPAYACVESNTKLEIKAEPYANITFKNERGVPIICKGGILEVTARGERDTTSIYAYDADNHIVGKVNVLSYDKVTRKICLVPIGDTKAPDASTVKQGLDEIFAKLMVHFDVTIGEPITIQYAKGSVFTHGGSGVIGVYNTDQKAAIAKQKERGVDDETAYLFLVEKSNALKDNDDKDYVSGYMPRGYQFGFIYHQVGEVRTIAHEMCHGAFHLKHTFDETDYLAPEKATDNLMDYNHGEVLNHWQWKEVHQPKSVRFKWLQDEEGAEAISLLSIVTSGHAVSIESIANNGRITVVTPAGKPFTISKKVKTLDFTPSPHELLAGSLCAFSTEDGETYVAAYRSCSQFLGYVKLLNPQAESIKDKIQYKADGKTPVCLTDSYTKNLSPDDIVLIGVPDGHNCAINVFPVDYSKLGTNDDVKAEGYCGSGAFVNQLDIDLTVVSPIVVEDPTACFTSKYAKEYYEAVIKISTPEWKTAILEVAKLLDRIASIEKGDKLFEDYKKYVVKNTNLHFYGDPELWGGSLEDYLLFRDALEAYFDNKEYLENAIKNLDNSSRGKLLDLSWLLVHRYDKSIALEVREHILNVLSQGTMHGNAIFGNGEEFLALRLLSTVPTKEDAKEIVEYVRTSNILAGLYNHVDDEFGKENFSRLIMVLSKYSLLNDNGILPDNIFTWDDSFINRDKINYELSFQEDGNLKIELYDQIWHYEEDRVYQERILNKELSRYDVNPYTLVPVCLRGETQYLPLFGEQYGNIRYVPALYLMALQTKHSTAVTKATVTTVIDVASIVSGVWALKGATTAIRVINAIDIAANSIDLVVTWTENDIRKLKYGKEFLEKYSVFSAALGVATMSAERLAEVPFRSINSYTDFIYGWEKFAQNNSVDEIVSAFGSAENVEQVLSDVDKTVEILRKEGVTVENLEATEALWKEKIFAGINFNRQMSKRYDYNEVYLLRPEGVNGKGDYVRLDSYTPGKEIVSRKYTQFSEIQIETGLSYIRELKDKYPQGALIADVPSNRAGGANAGLEGSINTGIVGTQILEVPVQRNPIPQLILDEATNNKIIIRDANNNIYNP